MGITLSKYRFLPFILSFMTQNIVTLLHKPLQMNIWISLHNPRQPYRTLHITVNSLFPECQLFDLWVSLSRIHKHSIDKVSASQTQSAFSFWVQGSIPNILHPRHMI